MNREKKQSSVQRQADDALLKDSPGCGGALEDPSEDSLMRWAKPN